MSYIETTPVNEASGAVREMYERQQNAWGYVPNYAKSFCHRPAVMERWGKLLAELKRPMDKRRFELITFAAAHELKHTSCTLAHGNALVPFFSKDEVVALAELVPVKNVTDAELEMMRFSRKIAIDASTVVEEDVCRLKGHGYSDAEIFDIAGVSAGRAFFTKVLDAVGSLPDAGFLSLDEEFRAHLTVGKSISSDPDEVMNELSD